MKKFWKIYSWVYLCAVTAGTLYDTLVVPVVFPANVKKINFLIAYGLVKIIWFIPVLGIFLYAFNKRKIMFFWRIFFVFYVYSFSIMLVRFWTAGKLSILLPFHTITLVGLFLYCFRAEKINKQ